MEAALLISVILSITLLINLILKLRYSMVWRVNCWFCNGNSWVKFEERNRWVCPKCDQYNGFTKDGDYNKTIFNHDQNACQPKTMTCHSVQNGLCRMCNINQQLKITQLANFVPMNEKNFNTEVEHYRMKLEKAYKLCNACKKTLLKKLHKEKEYLLGSKIFQGKIPENNLKETSYYPKFRRIINSCSKYLAGLLLLVNVYEFTCIVIDSKDLCETMNNIKQIMKDLSNRVLCIIEMKSNMTLPAIDKYINDILKFTHTLPKSNIFHNIANDKNIIYTTQLILGGFACFMQLIGHLKNINQLKYSFIFDLLWSTCVVMTIAHYKYATMHLLFISFSKIACMSILFSVYKIMDLNESKSHHVITAKTPVKMKNLSGSLTSADEDSISMDTDDDVSLYKFGLHNLSNSSKNSNDANSLFNNSISSGRIFTPHNSDNIRSKSNLNSKFYNSIYNKSPSSISETVFVKPAFVKYQQLIKDDSDSDLDEISSLCISSPKKSYKRHNSMFTLRKFTATPNLVFSKSPVQSRPLISPSKLGHSTSWVAGGYWGSENESQIFNVNSSRSSSQSSGFESQASSVNLRNFKAQPPSREDSVCGEIDKTLLFDRFQNCNLNNLGFQNPNVRRSVPVYPQMQYNNYVYIPQTKYAPQNLSPNQQFVQNNLFRAPGGRGLIKLPQVNDFSAS